MVSFCLLGLSSRSRKREAGGAGAPVPLVQPGEDVAAFTIPASLSPPTAAQSTPETTAGGMVLFLAECGLASFWILGIWITQCTTLGNQCDLVLHLTILNVILFSKHLLTHGLQKQFVSPRFLTYARSIIALG